MSQHLNKEWNLKRQIYILQLVFQWKHFILDMVGKNTKVVDLAAEIEKTSSYLYWGYKDPHIWLSPKGCYNDWYYERRNCSNRLSKCWLIENNSQSYKAKVYQVSKRISSSLTGYWFKQRFLSIPSRI